MASPVIQFKRGAFANLPGLQAGEPALTTDTYELYVGIDSTTNNNKFFGSHRYWTREGASTGSAVNLVEGTSNGSNYISLKAPDTLASNVTYTFPATPTNNYFLKTNSSGDLSWEAVVSEFNIAADSGTSDTVSTGSTITFVGGTNVNTAVTDNTITINLDNNISVTNLNATGVTTLAGNITLGDNTSDDITVGGEFVSSLNPSTTNSYDLGTSSQKWRNAWFSGNVNVAGIITATGFNDLLISNKDAVFAYIDGVSETDDTANHGGIAIASAEGTPLFDISVAGINTLPPTYKQLMWVKSGTFTGLSTDAWMFNYGVSIGTSTMASGVRLAVGTGVTVADTSVSATTFYGALSGNATTASSADQVKTVTANDTAGTYYVTFVDSHNGSATAENVYTDDGIYYNPGANKLTTQHAEFTGNTLVSGITTLAGNVFLGDSGSDVITVAGVTTFTTSNVYINNQLYVGGIQVTGGASVVGEDITARHLNLSGIATAQTLNILGNTTLGDTSGDIVTVKGTATFEQTITGTATTATRATTVDTTGTTTNATYYATFVDTSGGENGETLRTGTALSLNASTGNVKSSGDLQTGSGYLGSANGTRGLYIYDTSGDVSFQGKAIVNNIRSATDSNNAITLAGRDVTLENNVKIVGITTIGTGVGVTQFSGSVSTGSSTSSVPTSSAVIDYVTTQVGNVDVTLGLSADSGGPSTVSTAQTLTISGTANEVNTSVSGQTVTVGLPDAVSVTTSLTTPTVKATNVQANDGTTAITITNSTGAVATNSDLTVGGNLYINGSTTQVNTTSLTVEDSLVELGFVNGVAPSSDLNIDLGILFNYYTSSAKKAAVYWDDSASRIAVASDVSESSNVLTASAYAALEIGALWVNDCAGQSQVISCSGSTRKLENITIDAGTF